MNTYTKDTKRCTTMSKIPTEQETIKMLACLPFALDPTLPKDAEDQLRSVFTAYIDLMKTHQAMKEALEKVIKELRHVRDNDYDNWVKVLTPELMEAWTQVTRALALANGGTNE